MPKASPEPFPQRSGAGVPSASPPPSLFLLLHSHGYSSPPALGRAGDTIPLAQCTVKCGVLVQKSGKWLFLSPRVSLNPSQHFSFVFECHDPSAQAFSQADLPGGGAHAQPRPLGASVVASKEQGQQGKGPTLVPRRDQEVGCA